jgi:predicted alpha/beta superfamily hydrolase
VIELEKFQVRGLPGVVNKVRFLDRKVDFWAPEIPGEHILVAFDGQNVLDKRNIGINPHQRATWKLAQSAIRIAELKDLTPPTVICIYHTPYDFDPIGRLREYTPARFMNKKEDWVNESFGLYKGDVGDFVDRLTSEDLLNSITEEIVPSITDRIGQSINPAKTALLGASMGGLAAIYGVIQKPNFFHTALSFSPHWVIGGDALAEKMMNQYPAPGNHKLWMSRGTKGLDAKYEQSQKIADQRIRSRGYSDGRNLITKVLNRGAHSNATWARYVPGALDFWMKG